MSAILVEWQRTFPECQCILHMGPKGCPFSSRLSVQLFLWALFRCLPWYHQACMWWLCTDCLDGAWFLWGDGLVMMLRGRFNCWWSVWSSCLSWHSRLAQDRLARLAQRATQTWLQVLRSVLCSAYNMTINKRQMLCLNVYK